LEPPPRIDTVLVEARKALAAAGVESAALDARLLLADATRLDAAQLIARGGEPLSELAATAFHAHLERRLAGEPVARILGAKEFWGLSFGLSAATLVPRPDTEILVEAALELAAGREVGLSICDLGTGSGAILVALLKELPQAHGVATDISAEALAIAKENAERHGVAGRMRFEAVDFADGPEGPFDIVVANPPYVRSADIAGLAAEVRDHDPRPALDGGPDGLSAYRKIAGRADALLGEEGALVLEVGAGMGKAVAALLRAAGLDEIEVRTDLSGGARVLVARRSGKKSLGKRPATG
jgi:release factor glutamine methyltransferase